MSARDDLRKYVRLLADSWTPPSTTDARVERLYAAIRAEVLAEAEGVAVRTARSAGDDERGQYVASVLAGVAKELRRLAAGSPEATSPYRHRPSVPGTCARSRATYDWVNGTTPKRETSCRPYPEQPCVATCRIDEDQDDGAGPAEGGGA